jgi:hypothetical protein
MRTHRFLLLVLVAWLASGSTAGAATSRSAKAEPRKAAAISKSSKASPAHHRVLPFISDDYDQALRVARAKKLPLFIESWAPW